MKKLFLPFVLITIFSQVNAESSSQEQAKSILQTLRQDLTSLSADFQQQEIDINQNESEVSSGKVWLNSPNQFRWEYINPAPQLIVANGEQVWIYDEDLEQVTIKPQDSSANPIYVLLDDSKTDKNYQAELIKVSPIEEENDYSWIELTPKNQNDEVKQIWLGVEDNMIRVLQIRNQMENNVVFKFSNTTRNPEIKSDLFNFSVPEGTDILMENPGFGESDY